MEAVDRYCPICGGNTSFQVLHNSSHAVLYGSSHAELHNSSHAKLYDSSHAVLYGSSHAELYGSSYAELYGSSYAELYDSSHAMLHHSSHAVLYGSSHAELHNSSHAVLHDSSHAKTLSPYALIVVRSRDASGVGNIVGDKPISPGDWLSLCGVSVIRGYAMLYKSVLPDLTTRNGVSFKPKTRHVAPDWDSEFEGECGKGIHYSPSVGQARLFRDEGVYVACRVKVSDIASLPAFAEYPDKIRAKGGYALYRVDENGKEIKE